MINRRGKFFRIAVIVFAVAILATVTIVIACCTSKPPAESKVTITFETNGGEDLSPVTVKTGEKYLLPTPKKTERVFSGWYEDKDFAKICGESVTPTKDMTVYARWSVTITFETSGGTAIAPKTVYENEQIGSLSASYKDGYNFSGWYYDAEFAKKVSESEILSSNVTFYALFTEIVDSLRRIKSVKNASVTPEFEVITDEILHNDNISDYITLTSLSGEEVGLRVKPSGDGRYVVEPNVKLGEGIVYSAVSLSKKVKFACVDGRDAESADEVTITTAREEIEVIEKKPTVHLSSANLAKWEENVYVYSDVGLEKEVNRIVVRTDKQIAEGSVLTIGESETESDEDYICKVISVRRERMQYVVGSEISEDEFLILDVVTPNVDDIYGDVDIFGIKQAELEGYVELSPETVAANLEANEGVVKLKNSVKEAVTNFPTVLKYAEGLSENDKNELMATLMAFSFQKPKVKVNISGTELSFEIELGGEIQIKSFKLSVNVVIANSTSIGYSYTICKSRLVTLNPLLWFYTNISVELANDFSIGLQVTVEFADADDAKDIVGRIDISDEVQQILDANKDGQDKLAEAIAGSPLWNEEDSGLEYVDIFNIPLGQIPLFVPIVSLQIDFNIVGSLGARAGLFVEFSHHYVEKTTLANGETDKGANGKPVMFNEFKFSRATTANEIEIAVTLKGQVGFRCGLEAKLSLSVLKLNSVAAVYVSFRFGPYIELSGLVSFRYAYDAVNRVSTTSLMGGMYLEVGLFVNAKLGAKFLVYDVNVDIFDKKIKLYGMGDRLIPLNFKEKSNSPDDPYVITKNYAGVRASALDMVYLDIVTGEKVVDKANYNRYGATFDYELEFYDAPDYQTENYRDFIRFTGGDRLYVNKKYQLKSLKFAVKIKMLPKTGVLSSGVEMIVYVEYRNPDGRDLVKKNSIFRNDYYAGGGSYFTEDLARLTFTEGEFVIPPQFTAETLPIRQGYYLDITDLWEKYYPHMGRKVDENWDGTFGKVKFEDITNTYYRLKWKLKTYTANFYAPEYVSADMISGYKLLCSYKMVYVPVWSAFILEEAKDAKINAPEISGKKYESFVSSSGLSFFSDYFLVDPEADAFLNLPVTAGYRPIIRVDKNSALYLGDFEGISGGADFYATYTDESVFTETYVLESESLKRVKVEYKPFDYQGKTIRPLPPANFNIGAEFEENGKTYVITGYRDINAANDAESRYYTADSMPDVTKNRIYYILFERKGLSELPVYYVNITANGVKVGSYGVKQGEKINLALIKINFDDKRVISGLIGYPRNLVDEVTDGYEVIWNDSNVPAEMPENDITIELTATYTFTALKAEFVISEPLQSFAAGVAYETRANGERVHVATGRTWTFGGEEDDLFYSLPRLNDYFDAETKKYYSFYGWKDTKGNEMPYGVRMAFTDSESYTPIFEAKQVLPTIALKTYDDYGYEYFYKIFEGDYFGKKLSEVISAEKITPPERADASGVKEFEFIDWGVNAEKYVIGSEKDSDGNVKTYLVFRANFNEKNMSHTVTFSAINGKFANGENTLKVTGEYGEDISYVRAADYENESGKFAFIGWTTVPYDRNTLADKDELKIGAEDTTYYALYSLDPATITLTFRGKVSTDVDDGSGNVYFNGNKNQTEFKVQGLYGSIYYLTANLFAVDSKSKTFTPDYLKWTADGKEYVSAFYNDGYMANIPFDHSAVVEIVFKPAEEKIVNVVFVSDGKVYEPDGTVIEGVICNGFMSGFRHVLTYNEPYGTTISAPLVDFYSADYYVFDLWESFVVTDDGKTERVTVKAGGQITFERDMVFNAVYVHDTSADVVLKFSAETYPFGNTSTEEDLRGLEIFEGGSVELTNYGKAGEKISFAEIPRSAGKKFVGWTTDGKKVITAEELKNTTYSSKETYYAVYQDDAETFTVTLNAGNGTFGGKTSVTAAVPFGREAAKLQKPTSTVKELVFSHYEDENGYPVSVIEKDITLYAKYAKPISSFDDLRAAVNAPKENYVLTGNIKLGDWGMAAGVDWTAIGSGEENGFTGAFNGNGYKISFTANSGDKSNFGLFSRVGGTVFNLTVQCVFAINGETNAASLGALTGEVTETGRIIDCAVMTGVEVSVKTKDNLYVAGAVGINRGLIDGLHSASHGQVSVDTNGELYVGAVVGANFGTMRNVAQTGRGGAMYVSLTKNLKCHLGAFAGLNAGLIESSFSSRALNINLAQGDNVYFKHSIEIGGFAGRNEGEMVNCTTAYAYHEYEISNVTLTQSGMCLSYYPYDEIPRYIAYEVGKDNQGITYTTKFVLYLDDNAVKNGSAEYDEYTISEFKKAFSDLYEKIMGLKNSMLFGELVSVDNGTQKNCAVSDGNYGEIVAACGFNEIKWGYLTRLHNKVYD